MSYSFDSRTVLVAPSSYYRSAYSGKLRVCLSCDPESMTRQEFADECDINTIMRKYMRTGELPHVNLLAPQYFDASGIDFQGHMQVIAEAKSLFAELPSDVRNRFRNDPGQFIDFCSDPVNRKELATMGLLSPEATRAALAPIPPTATVPAAPVAPSAPVKAEVQVDAFASPAA